MWEQESVSGYMTKQLKRLYTIEHQNLLTPDQKEKPIRNQIAFDVIHPCMFFLHFLEDDI